MILPKTCKIEELCSTDKTRNVLFHPYLSGNELVATDGKAMICLPVELEEGDCHGWVSIEALKMARKLNKNLDNLSIKVKNDGLILMDGTVLPQPNVGSVYPNYRPILEANLSKEQEPVSSIAFNPDYLSSVASAFGCANEKGVKLVFRAGMGAIQAIPLSGPFAGNEKAVSIIMPIRTE